MLKYIIISPKDLNKKDLVKNKKKPEKIKIGQVIILRKNPNGKLKFEIISIHR